MQLAHIAFSDLRVSKCNMRYRDPPPDVMDILPSVRTKGILQPLVVRPEGGKYGVVAGRRRWFSLKAVKEETGDVSAPPCAIMEDGDDAAAIEASLLENIARRDPDPMREYETFVRLIKEGRTIDGIAVTFGMTATQVRQRLALGNLLPQIREAYRAEEIDDETVRHLTMASLAQQRKWLRLFNDPTQHAPRGYQLKQWLFGGQQIATAHALFKLTDYTGQVVEDLFGEDSYFTDTDLFWTLQNRAIAEKRDALLKSGWSAVDILEIGSRFHEYEHAKVSKKKGGKAFIAVSHDGAVEIHEGWLSQKEARKAEKAAEQNDTGHDRPKPATGPVMSKALMNYIDLHRHALVRQALIASPTIAWRLAVAHMVSPSGNWSVRADPQTTRNPAIRTSIETCAAEQAFQAERAEVHRLLAWTEHDDDTFPVRRQTGDVFAHLLALADAEVIRIATFFMAQSLETGSAVVEEAGARLAVDPRALWQADDTFFDLIRARATINTLLTEIAGEAVARANVAEKGKTQKQIVRDCLTGRNGRTQVSDWVPGWMQFPAHSLPMSRTADMQRDRTQIEPIAAE